MTAIADLTTFAQSLRRSMWRQSGRFHRTRLIVTGEYMKTSSRRTRP